MQRFGTWPRIVLAFAIIAFALGHRPSGENVANADEGKRANQFPRLDGVYRFERRTDYVDRENRDVYDYIVFSKAGVVYSITGDYSPVEAGPFKMGYYLEQPANDPPGTFHQLMAPLNEQPAFILKWLADRMEKPPHSGKYEVAGGVVRFSIKIPATPFIPAITKTYEGRAKGNEILLTESSTIDGREARVEKSFAFEPVNGAN